MASGDAEMLLSKGGVFIHESATNGEDDLLRAGTVFFWNKKEGIFFEWKENPEGDSSAKEMEWTMVPDTVTYRNGADKVSDCILVQKKKAQQRAPVINFDIKDLKSFRKSKKSFGWKHLIFILKCGTTYPALHFHHGGTKLVIGELQRHLTINRSLHDDYLYLVREHDPQALSKSFDELNLFEKDQAGDIITDPFTATIGGFSKVTNFFRDTLIAPEPIEDFPIIPPETGPVPEVVDVGGLAMNPLEGTEFEMITTRDLPPRPEVSRSAPVTSEQWSAFMDVEGRITDVDEVKEAIFRGGVEPIVRNEVWKFLLGYYKWNSTYKSRTEQRKQKVGGLPLPSSGFACHARSFPFLWKGNNSPHHEKVGTEDFGSPAQVGSESTLNRDVGQVASLLYPVTDDDYFRMKLQWKSINDDQQSRFSELRDRKSLIEKDVTRTDRTHNFFEGENNPNISVLYDILLTHCMYDFDLGYVQGMSDLLAPILVVMENEVDAFWCFAGLIRMMGRNFEKDQQAMKNQLFQLQSLVSFVDPLLANYLESHDSINMYFCFRWLLIVFKREFSFPDIMRLWEVLWTSKPCKNFHLLLCLAIFETAKTTLIENNFGFNEILKYVNDLSCNIDVDEILRTAEAIYVQLCACRDLPPVIGNILYLYGPSEGSPFQPFHPSERETGLGGSESATAQSSVQSSPDRTGFVTSDRKVTTQSLHFHNGNQETTVEGTTTEPTTPDDSSIEILSDHIDLVC